MKRFFLSIFFLISIFLLSHNSPILAQEVQKYTYYGPNFYGNYACLADPKGTLTYDECQAKLHAGKYTLYAGDPTIGAAPLCQQDPNGQFATYDDCLKQLHSGNYTYYGPDSFGNYACLADPKGTLTYDECQAKLHAGKYTLYAGDPTIGAAPLCQQDPNGQFATYDDCLNSLHNSPSPSPELLPKVCGNSCKTAIGDLSTDPTGFVKNLFAILLSLSGGIAMILIIISGYRLMASGGNPEKVQQAREQLTSAIVGLLFIIFSMTILQIIGVSILHIPGFK